VQSDYLRFADDQGSLGGQEATKQGKSLLGMIFGAGDITNLVCGVAEKTGISAGVVTNILPIMTLSVAGSELRSKIIVDVGSARSRSLADVIDLLHHLH